MAMACVLSLAARAAPQPNATANTLQPAAVSMPNHTIALLSATDTLQVGHCVAERLMEGMPAGEAPEFSASMGAAFQQCEQSNQAKHSAASAATQLLAASTAEGPVDGVFERFTNKWLAATLARFGDLYVQENFAKLLDRDKARRQQYPSKTFGGPLLRIAAFRASVVRGVVGLASMAPQEFVYPGLQLLTTHLQDHDVHKAWYETASQIPEFQDAISLFAKKAEEYPQLRGSAGWEPFKTALFSTTNTTAVLPYRPVATAAPAASFLQMVSAAVFGPA